MYNGIPVVGIPIFGDQRMNVQRAVNEGYGVMLSIKNITKEAVLTSINKGLYDKGQVIEWTFKEQLSHVSNFRIKEEVKRRQKVYLDQPEQPLERAVFWTEYILRHKGAPHMRSAALDLAWYQVQLLDVYAFLAFIIFLSSFTTCKVISLLCCRRKKPAAASSKKKIN
jgi:UDP-glucoronosyl and UDP-glucosyl transferase